MNNKTINYYNKYTKSFIQTTRSVNFTNIQNKFLSYLPSGASILDFGCGSGRDTKYFLKRNYNVTAIDGSEEICKEASKYTGIKVKQMLFEELNDQNIYDGIWACSSILHLAYRELEDVFIKMARAMGIPEADKPEDFITALVKLQKDCGVDDLRMSDYGFAPDESMRLAVNARETMGGLFLANPCEMTDEECADIFEKSYR